MKSAATVSTISVHLETTLLVVDICAGSVQGHIFSIVNCIFLGFATLTGHWLVNRSDTKWYIVK